MIVFNTGNTMEEYVEATIGKAHILVNNRPAIGWSVSTNVFADGYEGLVDKRKAFVNEDEAWDYIKKLAAQFGLTRDHGLCRRKRIWTVR